MFFTQIEFLFFIVPVLLLAYLGGNRLRKIALLAASLYFYGYWDLRFLLLLAGVVLIDYLAGRRCAPGSVRAKRWMLSAVILNIGLLAVFKYCNFFIDTVSALIPGCRLGALHLILPLGISFFTFQSVSYIVDVYKGKCEPCTDLLDFALFILYFPKLVVGPIVRAADFIPQLAAKPDRSFDRFYDGVRQFVFGLFQKLFVADTLALFVNPVWENHGAYDSATVWLAVIGYTLQIYCDFSGYSNMAIGLSRVLGIELCENFDIPYLSVSVTEFWRRWHISLSTWLRDYVYIPLGGNRNGVARSYWNLFATMVIGGLWHGAAWTFVFWGAWHGAALMVHKAFLRRFKDSFCMPRPIAVLITLFVVVIGWVFFRSTGFGEAFAILEKMFTPSAGVMWLEPCSLALIVGAVLLHVAAQFDLHRFWMKSKCTLLNCTLLWLLLLITLVFKPDVFQPFVYNQF